MREYELMVILNASLEERDVKAAVERYFDTLSKQGGKLLGIDYWGKRRFSYEIQHMNEGWYTVARFEATPEMADELSRVLGLADQVVRHKILRPATV